MLETDVEIWLVLSVRSRPRTAAKVHEEMAFAKKIEILMFPSAH